MLRYKISAEGEVAARVNGDPWSDYFFGVSNPQEFIEELERKGWSVQRIDPPDEEVWGGPAHPPVRKRRVIAIARK